MKNQLVVIDDDIELVTELRHELERHYQPVLVVGPPDLPLDLSGVSENIHDARAVVLDLNIGGSNTYGQSLLRKIKHKLKRPDTPVIVWSKYLVETIVFEPAKISRLLGADPASPVEAIADQDLESLPDYKRSIHPLRGIYHGARAFVSKASPRPDVLLCAVLKRLGVIVPKV